MRARLIGAFAAGAALVMSAVLAAGPAAALPATWSVSPGGNFTGTAGQTTLTTEGGVELICDSASASGTAKSGSGLTNPLAQLPVGNVNFVNCTGPFGLTFDVEQVGTWDINGDTYDGSHLTTGRITNITANIHGPACEAVVTGFVNATYDNNNWTLSVKPDLTLTITVDPANDCLGLITSGEHAGFAGDFVILPHLTITSP